MAVKRSIWEIDSDEENSSQDNPHELNQVLSFVNAVALQASAQKPSAEQLQAGLVPGPLSWSHVLKKFLSRRRQKADVSVCTSCSGTGSPSLALKAQSFWGLE